MADIGKLYEQNAQAVYRYIRSRGFDEDTAADLMQETFFWPPGGSSIASRARPGP